MKAATEGPTYPPFGSTGANKATSPRQTRPPRAEIGPSRLKEHVDRTVQLAIATAVVAGTGLLPLLGHTVPTLALTVFLSGLAISPVFITAFGLIERRSPASMLTEGITWAVAGIGIGMALGAFVAGWVVDVYGARSGFYVGIAAGAAALSTVLLAQGALARERSATLPLPVDQPAE